MGDQGQYQEQLLKEMSMANRIKEAQRLRAAAPWKTCFCVYLLFLHQFSAVVVYLSRDGTGRVGSSWDRRRRWCGFNDKMKYTGSFIRWFSFKTGSFG